MADIGSIVLELIAQYGLVAIFVLLVLDAAMLMPLFPAEVVLILAVARYAEDLTDLLFLVGFSSLAALVGSLFVYGLARSGGRSLLERYPRFFKMPQKRRERLERVFANPFGQTLVLWLRLFPLTRVLVNIPAGLANMPLGRFVALSSIGLVAFHGVFLGIAYGVQQEDSFIQSQGNEWAAAYADPAMRFVQANLALTAVLLLLVGAVLSVRASRNMLRNPEEASGTLLGTLAVRGILFLGIALGVALYVDHETVFALLERGGLPREQLGPRPVWVLGAVAAGATLLGWMLGRFRRHAKKHRRADDKARKQARKEAKRAAKK